MNDLPPPLPGQPPSPAGQPLADPVPDSPRRPVWRRWWFLTIAAVVILAVVASALDNDDDTETGGAATTTESADRSDEDDEANDDPVDTTDAIESAPSSEVETGAGDTTDDASTDDDATDDEAASDEPTSNEPESSTGSVIGETVELRDGSLVRVNALMADAPPLNEFFTPGPGFTFTRLDVELCAGSDGLSVNPLYWRAFLDDNTEASASLGGGDLSTVGLAPGGCGRGTVDVSVPDGAQVSSIVLTGSLFAEVARWSAERAEPVSGPLTPPVEPASVEVGDTTSFGDGHSAVVRSVTTGAAPTVEFLAPGSDRQLVEIDVEVCAGSTSLPVNPLYWLVTAADHVTGTASLGNGTLGSLEVAAGQCVAGTVQLELPEGAVPAFVMLLGPIFDEEARWRVS